VIPDKYIELINQEIDGANTPQQSAELRDYLKGHPEGLRCFDELNELTRSFHKMGQIDPPPQLRSLILARIAASGVGSSHEHSPAAEMDHGTGSMAGVRAHGTSADGRRRGFRWSLGFAFAAGLVVGICLVGVFMKALPGTSSHDLDKLYGTITSGSGKADFIDEFPIDGRDGSLTGSATVHMDGERIMTGIELQSEEPVQVVFMYTHNVQFDGVKALNNENYTIDIQDGSTSLHLSGTVHAAVFLTQKDRAPVHMSMKILSGENAVFEKTLFTGRN
jgi:hypothetical protein